MISAAYQFEYEWVAKLHNRLSVTPVEQRWRVATVALKELSEPPREFCTMWILEGVDMGNVQREQWQRSERIYAMVFGVATIIFLAVVALAVPEPKPFPLFVFRLICSLGAGAVGAFLPGSLTTSINRPSLAIKA